jgi:hypothetical protein
VIIGLAAGDYQFGPATQVVAKLSTGSESPAVAVP